MFRDSKKWISSNILNDQQDNQFIFNNYETVSENAGDTEIFSAKNHLEPLWENLDGKKN